MKIVLDTNVLIAGFISHGTCSELIEHCTRNHSIILSRFILDEVNEKLISKFGFTPHEAGNVVTLLESRFEILPPLQLDKPICRDPDDDQVIGTALAGNCECIVTGDKDLLELKQVKQVHIVSPANFWAFER